MICQERSGITMRSSSNHFKTQAISKQSIITSELSPQKCNLQDSFLQEHNQCSLRARDYGQHNNHYSANGTISGQKDLPPRCHISPIIRRTVSPDLSNTMSIATNNLHSHLLNADPNYIGTESLYTFSSNDPKISTAKIYTSGPVHEEQLQSRINCFKHDSRVSHSLTSNIESTNVLQLDGKPQIPNWKTNFLSNNIHSISETIQGRNTYRFQDENENGNMKGHTLYTASKNTILHNKATRSSSFPTTFTSQSFKDLSGAPKRQSLQLCYSSRSSFDNFAAVSATNSQMFDHSYVGTHSLSSGSSSDVVLPCRRGSDSNQYLQRTLSREPNVQDIKREIVNSPSWAEIDSEYVTLDQRYQLPQNSSVYRGTESSDIFITRTNRFKSTQPLNENAKKIDCHYRNIANSEAANIGSVLSSSELTRHFASMHLTNITLSEPRKHTLRRKSSLGTLSSVTETVGSVSSTMNFINSPISNGYPGFVGNKSDTRNSITLNNIDHRQKEVRGLMRSKSLSDLQNDVEIVTQCYRNYSDDEDGDDFGFLSYPILRSSSYSSTAMNKAKAKSPSPGNRMFPKRWRSKTKAVPAASTSVAMWTPGPQGSCSWSSVSGRKVQLRPTSILNLTEPERMVLQRIALSKLQSMDIGCHVSIPNENSDQRRAKKSPLSLKRRSKSVSSSAFDTMLKEGTASSLVFGIPLSKCLVNDKELEKKRSRCVAAAVGTGSPTSMKMRTDSRENLCTSRSARKSSASSQGSPDIGSSAMAAQRIESVLSHKRAASADSLSESESSRNTSSSLIDALSLSTSNPASRLSSLAMDGSQLTNQNETQVPHVVKACFRHIETYGLQTLGIFRVGCSKKRVKQLREEFDSGKDVQLTDEHNPHDVGALLKEYFRDLPDPLLTRELYLPFLHAERVKDEHKKHLALSLLISMLPVANRDTLWALLQFLATVSQHATDFTDEKGEMVSGNKMDAHNLATLFGPNIIHRTKTEKSSDKELLSESAVRVGQSKEIIEVVKDMIDNHHELFEISGSLRDEVLRLLIESNQEVTDKILRHIANQNQIETDPESMCSVFEDSASSPVLYHSMNSDADLLAYAQKQAILSHRPLRITKSAADTLDSPLLISRVPLLSESQAISPAARDNHRAVSFNTSIRQLNNCSFPSPVPTRVPMMRVYTESANPEGICPGRSKMGILGRPTSEQHNNKSLNIPQPLYFRKNSSSSINSDLSSFNGHCGSENGLSGQWILPTPPSSRSTSPKLLFQSASSSTTLVASPTHSQTQDGDYENSPPVGSAEWERDRWKLWEKIAAQKKNIETEQETLV